MRFIRQRDYVHQIKDTEQAVLVAYSPHNPAEPICCSGVLVDMCLQRGVIFAETALALTMLHLEIAYIWRSVKNILKSFGINMFIKNQSHLTNQCQKLN